MRVLLHGGSLGQLSLSQQDKLNSRLEVLRALQEQAMSDIIFLSQEGEPVDDLRERHNALATALQGLQDQLATMQDAQAPTWSSKANDVESGFRRLLDDTTLRRQRSLEKVQFRGLWWGAGALALVGVITGGVLWARNR